MDLEALTDEELDALQLAVNTEIGARRQKSRISERFARVIEEAANSGVPSAVIDAAVKDGKAMAAKRNRDEDSDDTPTPILSSSQTNSRKANTID